MDPVTGDPVVFWLVCGTWYMILASFQILEGWGFWMSSFHLIVTVYQPNGENA